MELTRIAPALQNPEMTLIQPLQFQELTEQESALRHRLELRERTGFFPGRSSID